MHTWRPKLLSSSRILSALSESSFCLALGSPRWTPLPSFLPPSWGLLGPAGFLEGPAWG